MHVSNRHEEELQKVHLFGQMLQKVHNQSPVIKICKKCDLQLNYLSTMANLKDYSEHWVWEYGKTKTEGGSQRVWCGANPRNWMICKGVDRLYWDFCQWCTFEFYTGDWMRSKCWVSRALATMWTIDFLWGSWIWQKVVSTLIFTYKYY